MDKEKITKIITILIGLCIVFARIILPSNITITKNIVILEMFLEFLICMVVITLNRKDITKILKEKTKEKLWKYILKIIFLVFLVQIGRFIIMFIWMFIYYLITGTIVDITPAALEVENSFFKVAPIPLFICQCIIAPVSEEIVFRKTLHELIKNKFIYVIISSLLFGFIHTGNFLTFSILNYVILGSIYCIIYLKNKDLKQLIGIHMLNNIIVTIITRIL